MGAGLKTFQDGILVGLGTAAAPSLAFDGDEDTGFYRYLADQIGVSLGGAIKWRFDAASLYGNSGAYFGTGGGAAILNGTAVTAQNNTTTLAALTVKAVTGQTASLQEWNIAGGAALAKVSPLGFYYGPGGLSYAALQNDAVVYGQTTLTMRTPGLFLARSDKGATASDVAVKVGTAVADASLSATAKLFSVVCGIGGTEVEKAAFYSDGSLVVSGFPKSRISCTGSVLNLGSGSGSGDIPVRTTQYFIGAGATTAFYASSNGGFASPNTMRAWSETLGGVAGHNCVLSGAYINTALDAGARLHAFGKNLGDASPTIYSAIMATGEFEHFVAGAGIILASPDGTRYRLTVANGGTLAIAAA
jgi:hypothetical protein